MIGNNFTLQLGVGFNPLLHLDSPHGEKESEYAETSHLCPASQLLLNELTQLGFTPESPFVCFTNELAHYSFHIIVNAALAAKREEELIAAASECEELEIEPLDIWHNPERAAWAVQNQAFVALKQIEGQDKVEMKWAPKWADLIEKGKIKQLAVKNEKGEIRQTLQQHEMEVTRFTAEEVAHISGVTFKAIGIVHQIRSIEQERKIAEAKKKKEQREIQKRENQFKESCFQSRLKGLWKQCCLKMSVGFISSHSNQQRLLEQKMRALQEEMREKQRLIERDELHARIIKRDIEQFELKREILKREVKTREIQKRQVASVDLAARHSLGHNSLYRPF